MQILSLLVLFALACNTTDVDINSTDTNPTLNTTASSTDELAIVTNVSVSGNENSYNFSVTISSPDTGCNQYADWWEVVDLNGNLLYRRILAHSHVNEQPFTRSGGTVAILADTEIYVRAHMNNASYGTMAMKGTTQEGFKTVNLDSDFAKALENEAPLPNGCAF